jgi:Holliday junction resolvasome RuvABC ATP-dependent DNA helicase subunit
MECIDMSDIQATVMHHADIEGTDEQEVNASLARLGEGIPRLAQKLEALLRRVRMPAAA